MDSDAANKMITELEAAMLDPSFVGKKFSSGDKTYEVAVSDNFAYTDPVDGSVSKNQVSFEINSVSGLFCCLCCGKYSTSTLTREEISKPPSLRLLLELKQSNTKAELV